MADLAVEPAIDTTKEQSKEKDNTEAVSKPEESSSPKGSETSTKAEPAKEDTPSKSKDRLQTSNWADLRDKDNAKDGNKSSDRDRDRPRRGGRDHYQRGSGKRGGDDRQGAHRGGHHQGNRQYRERQKEFAHNVKSDLTSLPTTDDPREIRKQVEFYFSDSNLPQDRFLLLKVGGFENRPVPVSVITNFKRMRRFQPYSAVVAALRESELLDIVGPEGEEEIQRKEPLPDQFSISSFHNRWALEDMILPRTIYAKGFDEEGPTTQFDIEAFFAPYGPTNAIRLRRDDERVFKKSVFVEFSTEEGAREFLEMEAKPKWQGRDLMIMSKQDYVNMKKKESPRKGRDRKGRLDREDRRRGSRTVSEERTPKKEAPEPVELKDDRMDETLDTPTKKRSAPDGGHEEDGGGETKKAKQDVEK